MRGIELGDGLSLMRPAMSKARSEEEMAAELLRQNPTPEAMAAFDRVFGEGAARKVLWAGWNLGNAGTMRVR